MTKFILVMYMCSMATGECPSNHIPGFSFTSHIDCVENGYKVVKFECQQIRVPEPIMPRTKPKIST